MIQYARGGRRAGWPKVTYVQCRVYTACSTDLCKFTIAFVVTSTTVTGYNVPFCPGLINMELETIMAAAFLAP